MAIILLVLLNVLIILLFIRLLMQLVAINPSNNVVQSTVKATSFLDIFNSALPKLAGGRINLAALILLPVLFLLKVWVSNYSGIGIYIFDTLYKGLNHSADGLILGTLMAITDSMITFCRYLIFAAIVTSLISMIRQTRGPFTEVLQDLMEPILAPLRKILPSGGMLDFSPLIAILGLIILDNIMMAIAETLLVTFK
ncbi:YggT family protein [Acinetobacter sp. c3-l95]|uniref:YggT family protein n=1 Tax=Acinetobacter sp. c3-l95 TaxID=3342804 RepID=UPI0035B6C373